MIMFIYNTPAYLCMAVYLHYIGERWYTDKAFIKEGKESKVQRLTSYSMVKKLFEQRAEIYYARYDKERCYARVFAKGEVIGIASTAPYLRKIMEEHGILGNYTLEVRRCGSCYSMSLDMDHDEIVQILNSIPKDEQRRYKWFISTNIQEYNTAIDNVIEYKVRQRKLIVKDIHFTRGFIKLSGIGYKEGSKGILKLIKQHRLRNSVGYDDMNRYKIDMSKYGSLDRWLGGITC
jgi:hypothetical protein